MRIEIVFPVHNRREITLQCLRSLSRIEADDLDVGVVVVDDGSTDGTSEAIRAAYPEVVVIEGDGNLWFTEGTNVGIRRALENDPKYVLLMNDDQVFDADAIRFMVETAEKKPRSVVGPLLLLWNAPHRLFQTAPVWNTWQGGWQHCYSQVVWSVPDKPFEVDLIVGNCVLVPAEAMRECGLMNSKRFPNMGDAEYTPRLKKAGWNLLIDPRSRVFCQPNTIPPSRLRDKGIRRIFNELFVDLKAAPNLLRRLYVNLDTAPSKLQGFAAFGIFLVRSLTGRSSERTKWGETPAEPPLKTRSADTPVRNGRRFVGREMVSEEVSPEEPAMGTGVSPLRQLIFLWPYVEWGGAQIYLLAIMKEARERWDVVVILPRNSSPDIVGYIESLGVGCEFMDAQLYSGAATTVKQKIERQLQRFRTELTVLRHLKKYNLHESILHLDALPWQSWQFFLALSRRGANVFVTLHNALPRMPAWREAILKARMRFVSRLRGFHIFTSNQDTKTKFRGWLEEKFWQRIPVTYTCINPLEIDAALSGEFDRDAMRKKHGIDVDAFVVLCVGQFIDRKGRWVLLDGARTLLSGAPEDERTEVSALRFVWMTPKMPDAEDIKRIESYSLGDRFRLVLSADVGSKRDDILKFFRIADAFALPSFVEGLPIALLEAMAMSLPSISTNVNAIPEAIKHRETGLLIEAGDSKALANAIIELMEDDKLRERISQRGREFVMKEFDERVASRIALADYEECFAK